MQGFGDSSKNISGFSINNEPNVFQEIDRNKG